MNNTSIFCVRRDPMMRLRVFNFKHVYRNKALLHAVIILACWSCHTLKARVTLEMVHFDERAVGGAPEGCARWLMCRCEHILNAKSLPGRFRGPKA